MRPLPARLAAPLALIVAACGARSELYLAPPDEDAGPKDAAPDARDCEDEGITYIYVVTSGFELLSFDPAVATFTSKGNLDCPSTADNNPFSMAVDRKGTAYVVFRPDGRLFRASTATAACAPTTFEPGQHGFQTFGMGFATDESGGGETLFVAESSFDVPSAGLGRIDTSTYDLDFVAPFSEPIGNAVELTGTGDGRLFGLFLDAFGSEAHLAELDESTGSILGDTPLVLGQATSAFAFAFWGGDFYLFHADDGEQTTVTRFRPSDGSLVDVAFLSARVVGAGVSTCAPQ